MTDPEVIRAWFSAHLDEDERAAGRAASLCGCHPPAPVWQFDDEATDGRILAVDDPHPDFRRKLGRRWNRSYDGLFAAQHIVRHDPDRIGREVEAKRRRLARHAPLVAAKTWPPMCSCCEVPWPCLDVVDDAQSWADDPTMPEELKLA